MTESAAMRLSDLGPLASGVEQTLERLADEHVAQRLWAKDPTLWPGDDGDIGARLGWLDLVRAPAPADAELSGFVASLAGEELRDVVLLGMGGSSLGAEALRAAYADSVEGPRLRVLDSTHPDWVARTRAAVDPPKTFFVVASKSGTTAEVMAFLHYFWNEAERTLGRGGAGGRFVAITDPGTPLAELAVQRGFRHVFFNPPEIGGRFSVLSRFGRVPAALAGIDADRLLASGHAMASSCQQEVAENPGLWLGAVLGTAARCGRDLHTLVVDERLEAFALWVEQLVAESTGKNGRGILPIAGEPPAGRSATGSPYGADRLFVAVRFAGDEAVEDRVAALRAAGQPLVDVVLAGPDHLGGELFRWQMATAVAGHLLGVQPFDQPDVESTKRETRRILDAYGRGDGLPTLAAEDDPAAALAQAVAAETPRFVALQGYLDASDHLEAGVARLRGALLARGLASTFGYGPRFLHSTGQLHKGGPDGGLFVQLVGSPRHQVPVPGAGYGFGELLAAQAGGDLQALRGAGRRVLRLDLGDDPAAALARFADALA